MSDIEQLVRDCSAGIGLALSSGQLQGVCRYIELLGKWNRRINLVGTRDLHSLVWQHIADSLKVVEYIPVDAQRLVDVGSGAGLPGALIAVMRPDLEVTALEPVRKKHAFLSTVGRELGLSCFRPLPLRMDAHRGQADFERYDVAVSRATFALPEWLERARTLIRRGGVILGMEGMEQHALPKGAVRHGYVLGNRTRAIVVLASEMFHVER